MELLRVGSLATAATSAVRPAWATPRVQDSPTASSREVVQGLTQDFFQRSLQSALLFPLGQSTTATSDLSGRFGNALLAGLAAPSVTEAPSTGAREDRSAALATDTAAPVPSTVSAATTESLQTGQDALTGSASLEFALQTALRFGAGVGAQAAPAPAPAEFGTGLIRDAEAVARIGSLQARTGGPGSEAPSRPETLLRSALRTYQATPVQAETGSIDLMA